MTTMTEQGSLSRFVRLLSEHMQNRVVSNSRLKGGYEATLELIDQPWEDLPGDMELWRDGYEQCMRDIVDAIADEWGVTLPEEG